MNLKINLRVHIWGYLITIVTTLSGQQTVTDTEYDRLYWKGLDEIVIGNISAANKIYQQLISLNQPPTPVRKAKTDYLSLWIFYSDKKQLKALEDKEFIPSDSLEYNEALIYTAGKYLGKTLPDKAVPLLMQVIDSLKENDEKAIHCRIVLCEAYRQMHEFGKGIDMLREILFRTEDLSPENKAYACNRLAALYNECGDFKSGYSDSVIKYSELCMELSENIGSRSNMALSQNELSCQYFGKGEYEKAMDLSRKAVQNFIAAGMQFDAINTLLNQSFAYTGLKKYDQALKSLTEATGLCTIADNRNLFMRIYLEFSRIYRFTGDYREAWDFLEIARRLQEENLNERIDNKIYEFSAKYDLLFKEQKIREEQQKNDIYRKQKVILILALIILSIVFVTIILTLRFRKREFMKQQLIEAVIRTEADERKRLAKDLHDGLGPVLSAIKHYFQAYMDACDAEKETIGSKMQKIISGAIKEISRISHNISPYILEKHGLVAALENFVEPLKNSHKIEVACTFSLTQRFDLNKELTVYRCITELFSNTLKHANATRIQLDILSRHKTLSVHYSDNGRGFAMNEMKTDGMGLFNLRNRIETYGGKLDIESSPGMGIKVNIEIPLQLPK